MFTAVLCALVCACAVIKMYIRWKSNEHKLPPVYPGALPFIGHAHLLLTDPPNLWIRLKNSAKYSFINGGVIYGKVGTEIYYLITDVQDALTASNACIQKHYAFNFGKPFLGNGLVNASGEIWQRHRKLLSPAFSLPVIHEFLDIFNSQAKKLVKVLEHHCDGEPFNHISYLKNINLETVLLTSFGVQGIEDNSITKKYLEYTDIVVKLITKRFQTVWLHSDLLYTLSGQKKVEDEAVQIIDNMSNEIVQRKKAVMKNGIVPSKDLISKDIKFKPFMDLVLELSANGTFTDIEMRDEVNTVIGASFESISNQLLYTLMLLGAHNDVQNKILAELLEVLGADRDVYKDDLNNLVYTNAVIMESIRMYAAIPVILRYVDKDVKLKNYTMRAGSQCIIYPLLNQQEPMWGPDGDNFKPERWLDDVTLSGRKEFAGFGLGKRYCIGKQYAMASMKVFLAHFIRQYKITADMSKLRVECDFALKPVEGDTISIHKRT